MGETVGREEAVLAAGAAVIAAAGVVAALGMPFAVVFGPRLGPPVLVGIATLFLAAWLAGPRAARAVLEAGAPYAAGAAVGVAYLVVATLAGSSGQPPIGRSPSRGGRSAADCSRSPSTACGSCLRPTASP